MLRQSAVSRSVISVSLIAVLAITAFADTIRFKDGSLIKGKIIGFSGGTFTVVIGEGARRREMTFASADIESIVFDGQPVVDRPVSDPTRSVSTNSGQAANPRVVVSDNTASKLPAETKRSEPVATKRSEPVVTAPIIKTSNAKPIEVSVKVLADNSNNGWTNSGWVVRKGQRIKITGNGQITIGGGKTTTASGLYDIEDETKLLKSVPTGALIAVIGDDNNDFIYIGSSREFVATRDGSLFLGVNEGNLNDNSGSFDVKIEITPDSE